MMSRKPVWLCYDEPQFPFRRRRKPAEDTQQLKISLDVCSVLVVLQSLSHSSELWVGDGRYSDLSSVVWVTRASLSLLWWSVQIWGPGWREARVLGIETRCRSGEEQWCVVGLRCCEVELFGAGSLTGMEKGAISRGNLR